MLSYLQWQSSLVVTHKPDQYLISSSSVGLGPLCQEMANQLKQILSLLKVCCNENPAISIHMNRCTV